jgi:hypothetical protein
MQHLRDGQDNSQKSATWRSCVADATITTVRSCGQSCAQSCRRKTVLRQKNCQSSSQIPCASAANHSTRAAMRTIDTTPGLSAWETRQRKQRSQWANRIFLLAGLSGAGLYATPDDYNPLVHAGILALPKAPPDATIQQVNLAIPVWPSDLPKHRPSLAAARTTDQIEAAHVVGIVPQAAAVAAANAPEASVDVNQSGSSEPMLAFITAPREQPSTGGLAAPRKDTAAPSATKTGTAEDMATMRKRIFSVDR